MSPFHAHNHSIDKLIKDSAELRGKLSATVEELERFVSEFAKEIEAEEGRNQVRKESNGRA